VTAAQNTANTGMATRQNSPVGVFMWRKSDNGDVDQCSRGPPPQGHQEDRLLKAIEKTTSSMPLRGPPSQGYREDRFLKAIEESRTCVGRRVPSANSTAIMSFICKRTNLNCLIRQTIETLYQRFYGIIHAWPS